MNFNKKLLGFLTVAVPFVAGAKNHENPETKPAKAAIANEAPANVTQKTFTPEEIAHVEGLRTKQTGYETNKNQQFADIDSLIGDFAIRYAEIMNFKHVKLSAESRITLGAEASELIAQLEKKHHKNVTSESIRLLPYMVRDLAQQMADSEVVKGHLDLIISKDNLANLKGELLSLNGPLGPVIQQLMGLLNGQIGSTVFGRETNVQNGKQFDKEDPAEQAAIRLQQTKTGTRSNKGMLGFRYGTLSQDEDQREAMNALLGQIVDEVVYAVYNQHKADEAGKEIASDVQE